MCPKNNKVNGVLVSKYSLQDKDTFKAKVLFLIFVAILLAL